MYSACLKLFVLIATLSAVAPPAGGRELRVCADPNNMPFSNRNGDGFENRIAAIVADQLGANLQYVWWAQRRGFLRNTLNAGLCDVVPGTQTNMETLRTTRPYYRSGYVFVTREDGPAVTSLDDPQLKTLSIGVQLIGDDGANSPPVAALARRGIIGNLRGFSVYGDYARPDPVAPIVAAVATRAVDVAVVWGPFAGYFAKRQHVPLALKPVEPQIDGPQLPMIFDISMGVRKTDPELQSDLNAALAMRRNDIDAVLADYGVPRLDQQLQAKELP
jgi:mxaJ protein